MNLSPTLPELRAYLAARFGKDGFKIDRRGTILVYGPLPGQPHLTGWRVFGSLGRQP